MNRFSPLALCGLAVGLLAFAPSASAMPASKTCTVASPQVLYGSVEGKLTSSNVDPSQARFATCKQAKKVMKRVTELGVEEPKAVAAFYCRPTVSDKNANLVSYVCTFRGADTATFVKLTFKVTYAGG